MVEGAVDVGEMLQNSASRLNFCQVRLVRSRIWYPRRKMRKRDFKVLKVKKKF